MAAPSNVMILVHLFLFAALLNMQVVRRLHWECRLSSDRLFSWRQSLARTFEHYNLQQPEEGA